MQITEAQVAAFRARRGHLVGDGAPTLSAAAASVVGIQAQVDSSAAWSLSMRCAERPMADAIGRAVLEARTLVKVWAMRDTLHLFAVEDWPEVAAADALWTLSGRRGALPPDEALDAARARLADGPLVRSQLFDLVTDAMRDEMAERTGAEQALRYAAGRIPWRLSHLGELCVGPKLDGEQAYVSRSFWLPDLAFPRLAATDAMRALVRRYLAVNGPASYADVAHYFGTKRSLAKAWLQALDDELTEVRCGDRRGLYVLDADADALAGSTGLPEARLLAAYDTLLMAHADKSWTVPDADERRRVWRKAARVAPVVLAGGRAVATWSHTARARKVRVEVQPLSGWSTEYRAAVERDAARLAAHLDRPAADVSYARVG